DWTVSCVNPILVDSATQFQAKPSPSTSRTRFGYPSFGEQAILSGIVVADRFRPTTDTLSPLGLQVAKLVKHFGGP
ncbi:MAG: hypothetical protein AAFN70_21440, partial [Planctomycetota bacterium]